MLFFSSNRLNTFIVCYIMLFQNTIGFSQTWIEKDESENYIARHECGFVQVGDKFILFGGRESQTLEVYDYTSNTWSIGGFAPFEFNHFQAITYQGLIWVIGAFKTNTPNPEQNADYIFMYNPATQQWIQGMEIPESRKRGAAGLAIYNNTFYMLGGNTNGHDGGYVSYFDMFNPSTGTWTVLNNAPHARDHFQAVVYNQKLYAVGGRLSGGPDGLFEPQVAEVDVYDFETFEWSTLPDSHNLPTPRSGLGAVVYNGEIFTLGGETTFNRANNSQVNTVESFNPTTNTWSSRNSLNYTRHGFQPIVSGTTIYVTAGSSGGTAIQNMEYFGLDDAVGSPNINSIFYTDEATKSFEYGPDFGSVVIDITLINTQGTTGTYIDNISISGTNYSLDNTYDNLLINANSNITIQAILTNTTQNNMNGEVTVTYNNNSSLVISLEGTLNPTLSSNCLNIESWKLQLYPSPTKNTFKINEPIIHLQIFDMSGKLVKSIQGNFNTSQVFNVSELHAGLYIIKARNHLQKTFNAKLIKY